MWSLSFISENDFEEHVKATIEKYGEKLVMVMAAYMLGFGSYKGFTVS